MVGCSFIFMFMLNNFAICEKGFIDSLANFITTFPCREHPANFLLGIAGFGGITGTRYSMSLLCRSCEEYFQFGFKLASSAAKHMARSRASNTSRTPASIKVKTQSLIFAQSYYNTSSVAET
jgi:hypothetical protein